MNRAGGAGGAVGGWVELGRTTLGSASSTIDVTGLADKRYYMILGNTLGRSAVSDNSFLRMGNGSFDSSSSYSIRRSINGGADITYSSQNKAFSVYEPSNNPNFMIGYLANKSNKEKLMLNFHINQNATGSSNVPIRNEYVQKHSFTSNPIDQIQFLTNNADTFNSGSEVVVLGYDPSDTHTTNFWEELASVEADGSSTDMSSGTITAKKYLWIQLFQKGIAGDVRLRFNSDSGNNYNRRYNQNGVADNTDGSAQHISNMIGLGSTPSFGNAFIINNASNEKLVMGHHVQQNAAGAGSTPQRIEFVGKWANTSNQITNVNILSSSGNFPSGSILKVWGAD